jgi:hypothetical protein
MDQHARTQLLDELSIRLARHISHRLGVAAPLPRNNTTSMEVQMLFGELVRQSGVSLGPGQLKELYGKVVDALFKPPPSN